MPLTRQQKEEEVKNLTEALIEAGSVVFVNFHGLSVEEVSNMRRSLAEDGVRYKVIKKTLANIALEQSGIEGEKPEFAAELAIVLGSDALTPARSVYKFQRELEGRVAIIGGVFEGAFQSQEAMLSIAQIPSRETLLGMFVNVINSPVQGLAVALNQVVEKKEANA